MNSKVKKTHFDRENKGEMKQKLASKQFWEKMLVYSCKTKDIELFELFSEEGST